MGNAPDCLVACCSRQSKGCQIPREHRVSCRSQAHAQQAQRAACDDHSIATGRLERIFLDHRLRNYFGLWLDWCRLRRRRHRQRLAILGANDASDDDVTTILTLCQRRIDERHESRGSTFASDVLDQVQHVLGIHRTSLVGHSARIVCIADDRDAIVRYELLIEPCQSTIASSLCCHVHDHRARLHVLDHVFLNELGRWSARDRSGRDDDVALLGHLGKGVPLRQQELCTGLLGVTSHTGARLFEIDLDPVRTHRLHLIAHVADVPGAHHGAERLGGAHRRQPGHAAAEDHGVRGRILPSRGDLRRVEALEGVSRLNDSPMSSQLGL
mmetsp:Transcript_41452/g.66978  ORF Transcript_41452/g.66978 Transcript_41452/m.66978 type:complete len:327 (-) Transcript_41452:298-1278(-)